MTSVGTFVRRHFEPLLLSVQVLVDLAVVFLCCWLGYEVREAYDWDHATRLADYREVFLLTGAICLISFHAFGLYNPLKSLLNIEEFKGIAKATISAFVVVNILVTYLTMTFNPGKGVLFEALVFVHEKVHLAPNPDLYSRLTVFLAFLFILVLTTLSRFVSFKVIQNLHRRGIGNRNVLILGTGPTARSLQKKFLLVPTLGLNLRGFISEEPDEVGRVIDRSRVLGSLAELEEPVLNEKVSEVFVALPECSEERVMTILEELDRLGVVYHVVPRFYHLMAHKVRIESLDSIPLISKPERGPGLVSLAAKRALDVTVSLLVLALGAPFFLVPAILIKRESPGPVFFLQTRIGRDGKPFRMIKFRTMHTHLSGDAPTPSSKHDPRITRIGRFLRRYSLDELPQVLNVLRGDMSIVGPRPEMPFIVDTYGAIERERLRAKPGLTGLWQISYARGGAIHDNIDYDIYYVENQSLLLDLVIISLTAFAVVKGSGAY